MYDPQKIEEEILKFWKDKKIYGKSKEKNSNGKKFYLMDGPPYATGHIHIGTALNKILKDIAMRSKRLQGNDVFDRAGYDTHGLPIEYQIEKQIGTKTKEDIKEYGIKKFIKKCKEYATKHLDDMNSEFKNLGVWMDFENAYLTLKPGYIETIWDTFKKAEEKNLLYLGKYPVHVCPRCETAVAYNEIEYNKIEDTSVFVKFPLKEKEAYLIIWTTTPWTLPGNTGVMVHPDYTYQEIDVGKERWVIAKKIASEFMKELGKKYKVKNEFKGKNMKGWKYKNPLDENLNLKINKSKNYKVVLSGRYVNLDEGTGLVHTAPGHGKEDFEVGKKAGLEMPSPVGIDGKMSEEAGKYKGKKARKVNEEIIKDLEKKDMLVYKHKYSHDYPFCWRCNSALLMLARPQWFLKISKIQKKLLKENEKTNWIPDWMKSRMKAWLEGIGDWPISRKRYWGTPLPIWVCECGKRKVVGSVKELEKLSKQKVKDIHKPEIDKINIKCECGKNMKRVEEVLDVWFDSGVSSWAALNYSRDKEKFRKYWPADLNAEGKDQVRGWWNSQLILSEIKFGKKPFETILEHGMVLDLEKRKMSKSKGNVTSPKQIINNYGRDKMRYYFAKTSKGEDFAFNEQEFKDIKNVFRVLVNVNKYISQMEKKKGEKKIEDRWILSRLNSTIKKVTENYNSYNFPRVIDSLERLLVNDVSKNYIQMTRERSEETCEVLKKIRKVLLKLAAPIIPFITEKIWQDLKDEKIVKEESIHLTKWPKADKKKIDKKLEKEMDKTLDIIEAGLRERDKVDKGLKWPLKKATVNKKVSKEFKEIIKRQLNVKKVKLEESRGKVKVKLETKLTKELEAEGYARVLSRKIQSKRKKAGLNKKDKINLEIVLGKELLKKLKSREEFIKNRVNAKRILLTSKSRENFKNSYGFRYKNKKGEINFEKVKS